MRPPADYTVIRDLKIPGSDYAYRARSGDEVTEVARAAAGWEVGVDVLPLRPDSMERPADDADRAEWQNYAVVQGVPYEEAVNLDRADLVRRVDRAPESEAAPGADAEPPAETDRKAVWVDYGAARVSRATEGRVTVAEARDRLSSATKAELMQAFGPEGDEGPDEWYAHEGDAVQVGDTIYPADQAPEEPAER